MLLFLDIKRTLGIIGVLLWILWLLLQPLAWIAYKFVVEMIVGYECIHCKDFKVKGALLLALSNALIKKYIWLKLKQKPESSILLHLCRMNKSWYSKVELT